MLIQFFRKPNGQIDEQVAFSKKIRPIDNQTCNVIMDYKERKVLRCFIEGKKVNTDFDKMNTYYKEIYPQLVEQLEKINQSE